MTLNIIIIVLLIAVYLRGRRQGLLRLLLRFLTYLVSWAVAYVLSRPLGTLIAGLFPAVNSKGGFLDDAAHLTDVNSFFYNGLAFTIIFLVVAGFGAWIIRRFGWIQHVPLLGRVNGVAGGIFTAILAYLLIGWALMILQYWPGQWMQAQMTSSGLARWIINKTPLLAQTIISWIG